MIDAALPPRRPTPCVQCGCPDLLKILLYIGWLNLSIIWWLPAAIEGFTQYGHWYHSTKVMGIVSEHVVYLKSSCHTVGYNNGDLQYKCYGGDIGFRYLDTTGKNQSCTVVKYSTQYFQSNVTAMLQDNFPIGAAREISLIHRPKKGRCYWPDTVDGWKDGFANDMMMFGAMCLPIFLVCGWCCSCCGCRFYRRRSQYQEVAAVDGGPAAAAGHAVEEPQAAAVEMVRLEEPTVQLHLQIAEINRMVMVV